MVASEAAISGGASKAFYQAGAAVPPPPKWFVRNDLVSTSRNLGIAQRKPEVLEPGVKSLDEPSIGVPQPFGDAAGISALDQRAVDIAAKSPTDGTPYDVMTYFSQVRERNDANQLYINEWPDRRNPLIDFFLWEANVRVLKNDHVPWCAACINWCIKRA